MSLLNRRQFLSATAVAGVTTSLAPRSLWAANKNDEINLGFISCGGRGMKLMRQFKEVEGVNIAGLCDVDEKRLGQAKELHPKAQTWVDMRDMIASDSIDAVVISTCNHWHCLAAIWAMEAGKDVYVEKPLSHSQWEGRQAVAAARKYNRICQVGTHQRSDPMQAEIKKFLHEDKALGEIKAARVNRYGIRASIGKLDKPLQIKKDVAYDLWLGPAQDQPIFREKLHYDWHWDWNTGSGEMGNWGVHLLDDLRNTVFRDSVPLPSRIIAGGARIAWDDAGQSPNVHFAHFDTGSIPVAIGITNLPATPGGEKSPEHPGPSSGYIAYCEGGRFEGQRGKGAAFDRDGKKIKEFSGTGDILHQENFIEAVRKQDRSILNAEIAVGNDSTGWCNMANIAFRAGTTFTREQADAVNQEHWQSLIGEMDKHVNDHGLQLDGGQFRMSGLMTIDPETGQFVGEFADAGNAFLKREYRKGYEVPELEPVAVS